MSFGTGISIALAVSPVLFLLSLLVTTPHKAWSIFSFAKVIKSLRNTLRGNILQQLWTAFTEELVWRVCMQAIFISLFGFFFGVFVTALLFWAAHLKNVELLSRTSLDIIVFSIVLGFTFEVTSSFPLIVALHTLKNILAETYRYSLANQKTQ